MLFAPAQITMTGVRPSSSKSAEISIVVSAPRCTPPTPPVANTWIPARWAMIIVVATVVAPILQKALDEEGRGAFGCVAVDSPVVLSEADALELIRQEFAKAGVELGKGRELSGFTRTRTDWDAPRNTDATEETVWWRLLSSGDGDPARPQKTEAASWVFDLATEDGSLLLEYLSTIDHDKLGDFPPRWGSTVSAYDFPKRAARFRTDLETRTNGVPVTIGLFFDPMVHAYVRVRNGECLLRLDSGVVVLTEEEARDKQRELLRMDARERLREQVRYFLDWARKEGRLGGGREEP